MVTNNLFYIIGIAYVLGSIPSGLLIGKIFFNTDLREFGSKNIGATNAYRVLGLKPALAIFLCDALKGAAGVYLGMPAPELMIAGGISAILGHNCSVFLKFKGGRGVATGLGVIACLVPEVTLVVFLIWCLIVKLTKLVSLGSIVAALCVPIGMVIIGESMEIIAFGIVAALFVVIRHKDNIKRLLAGNELKVERINKE